MKRYNDLTNSKIDKLFVIRRTEDIVIKSGKHKVAWLCRCDCGREVVRSTAYLKEKGNYVKSCGCVYENEGHPRRKHGLHNNRIYSIYNSMKQRCNNPHHKFYKNYGGRGIKICPEWNKADGLKDFADWAFNNGYQDNLTIDRIDSDGNYEPSNCRWIERSEQMRNTRRNIFITYKGETKTLGEWSRELGIVYSNLYYWYKSGKTIDEIVFFNAQRKRRETHEIPDNQVREVAKAN